MPGLLEDIQQGRFINVSNRVVHDTDNNPITDNALKAAMDKGYLITLFLLDGRRQAHNEQGKPNYQLPQFALDYAISKSDNRLVETLLRYPHRSPVTWQHATSANASGNSEIIRTIQKAAQMHTASLFFRPPNHTTQSTESVERSSTLPVFKS